jgi:hypothetical protein
MREDRGTDALLRWVAFVVPGLSAGIGWSVTAGWPLPFRIVCGVAVGATIYAVIHLLLKGASRNGA